MLLLILLVGAKPLNSKKIKENFSKRGLKVNTSSMITYPNNLVRKLWEFCGREVSVSQKIILSTP